MALRHKADDYLPDNGRGCGSLLSTAVSGFAAHTGLGVCVGVCARDGVCHPVSDVGPSKGVSTPISARVHSVTKCVASADQDCFVSFQALTLVSSDQPLEWRQPGVKNRTLNAPQATRVIQ